MRARAAGGGRGGFVLAELLVAMLIAAIIGVALTQLVVSQSRFVALQGGIMQARGGARAALNVMAIDFRMVTDSGLVAANPDSVTVRVPYAFGVACTQNSGYVIVSLLPADSASYFSASIGGYAWRDTTGSYVFKQPATVSPSFTTFCGAFYTSPPVTTLSATGWSARAVYVPNDTRRTPPAPPPGTVVYLYQLVRYSFAPSAELPGRVGLWRTILLASGSTVSRNELVAPFDTSASFQFLDSTYTPHATPPANLNTVKGLRLLLVAASETAPEGRTNPVQFNITSDVVFRNHP
jgi:type II secretory pathway pseudopilin PulG